MSALVQYQIFRSGKDKLWYWRLIGGNGEIVCSSEGYKRRGGAIKACQRLPEIAKTTVISQLVGDVQ